MNIYKQKISKEMINLQSKILLSAREAGERYGISKWTFYRWALERKLPSYKIGKLRRYAMADLDKFFEQFKGNPIEVF